MGVIAGTRAECSDRELVAIVRAGDETAFEELYRRYSRRVAGYVFRMVGDHDRAEDVTQEAFVSALRRLRATDAEIAFKPWIFEIAKNAAIDNYRRTSRAEEVSINPEDGGLRPGDQLRLIGSGPAPETAVIDKERLEHLRGAFDELSESHLRIIVMREFEGLSYREIGERMEMTRPAVESTLFRARRRLTHEYAELEGGARCVSMLAALVRMSGGTGSPRDERRLARHLRRCGPCRREARELGLDVERRLGVGARVAALLPLPAFLRRRRDGVGDSTPSYAGGAQSAAQTWAPVLASAGGDATLVGWGKAAAFVATVAIAGGAAVPPHASEPGSRAGGDDGRGIAAAEERDERRERGLDQLVALAPGTLPPSTAPRVAKGLGTRTGRDNGASARERGDALAPGTRIEPRELVPGGVLPDGDHGPAIGGPGATEPIPSEAPDLGSPSDGGSPGPDVRVAPPAPDAPVLSQPQLPAPSAPEAPSLGAPSAPAPGSP